MCLHGVSHQLLAREIEARMKALEPTRELRPRPIAAVRLVAWLRALLPFRAA